MSDPDQARLDADSDIPSIDYRVKVIFNDVLPPDMRLWLDVFIKATGLDTDRSLFHRAMYLAQHPNAYDRDDNGKAKRPELDYIPQPRRPGPDGIRRSGPDETPVPDQNSDAEFPADRPPIELVINDSEREMLLLDASPVKKPLSRPPRRLPRFALPESRKWYSLPAPVKHVVFVCGLGAIVQGIDEAVVNGAQGLYLATFGIPILSEGQVKLNNAGPAGLINAAPYLCCVVSCWFTPLLNHYFGRRGTIFICALFSTFFAFAQAFANTPQELLFYRLLMGLGIGPKSASIPIYTSEIVPANIRGSLVTCWQAFTACGIAIGCSFSLIIHIWGDYRLAGACDFSKDHNPQLLRLSCSWNWRIILGFPMIAPILLAFAIGFCRESPRWTIAEAHRLRRAGQGSRAKHYYQKAFTDLKALSRGDLLAARDMFTHYFFLDREFAEKQKARDDPKQTWLGYKMRQLFGKKHRRNRRAINASTICMASQQLCGVNILIYYSNYVLQRINEDDNVSALYNRTALLHTMGFGIGNLIFALPAFLLIDMMGRRTLLLITFPFLAFSHILMAISGIFSAAQKKKMFLAGFYTFCAFYSPGLGPVPFVYAAESMPLSIREEAMGLVTSLNWLLNFLVAFSAPYLFTHAQVSGTFGMYAGFCVVSWISILLFVPETWLLTLKQLDIVFDKVSTVKFMKHALVSLMWRMGRRKTPPDNIYTTEDEEFSTRRGTTDFMPHSESRDTRSAEVSDHPASTVQVDDANDSDTTHVTENS